MIKRLTQLMTSLPRRAARALSSAWNRQDNRGRAEPPAEQWHWTSRLSAAVRKIWRVWAKAIMIAVGLGVFLGLQYALALAINKEQWYIVGAMIVGGICVTAIFAKPNVAFIVWLVASPIAGIYLRLGKVGDLPQITFDRVMIYTLAMVLLVRFLANKDRPHKLLVPEYLWLVFPVYILLTIPFFPHENPQRTALQFMTRVGDPLLVYFIAKAAMVDRKHISAVVAGLFAVGVYSSAMGVYDHFTGRMSLAAISGMELSLYYSDAGGRAAGPFLSPLDLGVVLCIAIPLAIHYAEWTKRNGAKIFYSVCIPIMAAAWFFTYTRGAYIPLIFVMLMMPFLAIRCRSRYAKALIVLVIMAMLGLPIYMARPEVAHRLTQDKTAIQRVVLAKTMVNLVKAHPWFGVGLANYRTEMAKYIPDVQRARWLVWHGGTHKNLPEMTASHNTYLTLMAEHGLVGAALLISSFLGFGLYILRVRKRFSSDDFLGRDLASLIAMIMVGFMLAINTTHMEGRNYTYCLIWTLIAVVVRLEQTASDERGAAADGPSVPARKELAV